MMNSNATASQPQAGKLFASPITVSFPCVNHNDVLLLTTFFDLITRENEEASLAISTHYVWLLAEVLERAEEMIEYYEQEEPDKKADIHWLKKLAEVNRQAIHEDE